jgi:hypothetical protein
MALREILNFEHKVDPLNFFYSCFNLLLIFKILAWTWLSLTTGSLKKLTGKDTIVNSFLNDLIAFASKIKQ